MRRNGAPRHVDANHFTYCWSSSLIHAWSGSLGNKARISMNVTSLMNVTGNGKAYAIEDHPLQVEQHFDQRVPGIKIRCE